MTRHFFASGLHELAASLPEDAVVHAGARPYGLHAGNRLPIVVYPILLAEELRRLGHAGGYRHLVTLNDWDTDGLVHAPGYPVNFIPRGRSFQHQVDPAGCCASLVDHWERQLGMELRPLTDRHPEVAVEIRRVSSYRAVPAFADTLRFGLTHPDELGRRAASAFGVPVDCPRAQLAGAVCPGCHSIDGMTSYDPMGDRVSFGCRQCGAATEDVFTRFDYWLYTHLVGAAKCRAADPDAWIFGGDFVEHRAIDFLERTVELLQGRPPRMMSLFTPVLLGSDGEKMSKSRRNLLDVPLDWLVSRAASWDAPRLAPPGGSPGY
ncbi:MAG: hypothetical protein HYY04_14635 [Chloroflexi bacterium]|nr:hypothetical protein [Chloroflexota bacterium]